MTLPYNGVPKQSDKPKFALQHEIQPQPVSVGAVAILSTYRPGLLQQQRLRQRRDPACRPPNSRWSARRMR